ncbi:helix-turn-helix domain-containing protein [Azorhizobium sp. AG788]|uniref:ArsR/SmtB family transcription factor n=1 Tax=Azorhizobium sp. AG788 TaxID=2183897 RepID=UPI003139375D
MNERPVLSFAMRMIQHPAIEDVALSQVLYALSDPVRLGVVRQLAQGGEATCSALDAGRPKSSMSHHFRVLREAGLVRTRTDGPAHMNELRRDELERRFPGLLTVVLAAQAEAPGRT